MILDDRTTYVISVTWEETGQPNEKLLMYGPMLSTQKEVFH